MLRFQSFKIRDLFICDIAIVVKIGRDCLISACVGIFSYLCVLISSCVCE